ncbi:hypothetical protein [Gimesia maris]|uniref:Uncharacterized protein n=1 Tax=Gimesia maris TaxID=122 RepID=A0ABX5YTK7_9PLAN|nr:hypothetical protein [Gimesia maris]QEG18945.1 hypothetical protein GmarT_48400 [Gimesia maris]QGQ28156.1 hypothetical protein F1729_05515 [Gimesia maris]
MEKGRDTIEGQGQIMGGTVYTLDRFMLETGLKRVALDSARRNGLTVRKVGRRCFIYGQDFIDHLLSPDTVQS